MDIHIEADGAHCNWIDGAEIMECHAKHGATIKDVHQHEFARAWAMFAGIDNSSRQIIMAAFGILNIGFAAFRPPAPPPRAGGGHHRGRISDSG